MNEIQDFGRRIGRHFRPLRVILFGSYARGDVTEDSDVDLLVVLPFTGKSVYQSVKIRMQLEPAFPVDILVRTPEHVQQRLEMGDPFMKEVLREGRVLYEADHC